MNFDVAILGGGTIGATTAFELSKAGLKVVLLEKRHIASGASGSSAAMIEHQIDANRGEPFFSLSKASNALFPSLHQEIKTLTGIDFQLEQKGIVQLAMNQIDVDFLTNEVSRQQSLGLRARWLDADAMQDKIPTLNPIHLGGAFFEEDGQVNGEWVEQQGEFFKSPLGGAYAGDLDLPNLKIRDMRLEAFRRPSACESPTGPLALVANYPKIDSFVGGYGATLKLVDTTTCQPVAVSNYTFEYRSDDPTIATLSPDQPNIPDYPPTLTRVGLDLVAPGSTVIHVVAKDEAGTVVGTAEMHITVRPGDSNATSNP